jgi:hypothetical protein
MSLTSTLAAPHSGQPDRADRVLEPRDGTTSAGSQAAGDEGRVLTLPSSARPRSETLRRLRIRTRMVCEPTQAPGVQLLAPRDSGLPPAPRLPHPPCRPRLTRRHLRRCRPLVFNCRNLSALTFPNDGLVRSVQLPSKPSSRWVAHVPTRWLVTGLTFRRNHVVPALID